MPVEVGSRLAHYEVVRELFPQRDYRFFGGVGGRMYDVSPVDERFLMTRSAAEEASGANPIKVVLNWHLELLERVPVD